MPGSPKPPKSSDQKSYKVPPLSLLKAMVTSQCSMLDFIVMGDGATEEEAVDAVAQAMFEVVHDLQAHREERILALKKQKESYQQ